MKKHDWLINRIIEYTRADKKQIGEKTRKREVVLTRQIYYTVRNKVDGLDPSKFNGIFNQDRTTINHAIKTIGNLRDTDKKFRHTYEKIENDYKNVQNRSGAMKEVFKDYENVRASDLGNVLLGL